nr:hypothetical protein Iba_chr13bCG7330 [Ipomoea batatas]
MALQLCHGIEAALLDSVLQQQPQHHAQLVEQTPIEQQGSVHEQPHGHYTPSTDLVEQQQVQSSEPISTSQHDTTDQESKPALGKATTWLKNASSTRVSAELFSSNVCVQCHGSASLGTNQPSSLADDHIFTSRLSGPCQHLQL